MRPLKPKASHTPAILRRRGVSHLHVHEWTKGHRTLRSYSYFRPRLPSDLYSDRRCYLVGVYHDITPLSYVAPTVVRDRRG